MDAINAISSSSAVPVLLDEELINDLDAAAISCGLVNKNRNPADSLVGLSVNSSPSSGVPKKLTEKPFD